MSIDPIVKVENLNVTYNLGKTNEAKVLKNISLEIFPGEFIIFFGPSGCGKSTLLYSISGLETDIEGNVYIDNKKLNGLKQSEIETLHQKKIGMIFQAYYLIASLSVIKNVVLPQIAIGAKIKEREEKAQNLLDKFGVGLQSHKLPNELSGGQQQRVAVCRSLINDPDILMADEPVGNLDSKSAADVMSLLRQLNDEQKKTIILVTHDASYLDYAHRVFHIKDGVLIQTKVNRAINDKVVSTIEQKPQISVSRELELLSRSFPSILDSINSIIPFKSKEIVTEALIGMTADDVSKIEAKVRELLEYGIREGEMNFYDYLDKEVEDGGLGMDKRNARKIADKIFDLINEIKNIRDLEDQKNKDKNFDELEEVVQIRQYLLETFSVDLQISQQLTILDNAIKDRLDNKIDSKMFKKILDLPIKESGLGLDSRTAKKMTRGFELLILGKYKN
ncbi:TPA: hypothetical protein DCZ46_00305 [Candidatus Campbellbacteria bacterium]|nr:MAG: antimicrobial peptide ABC transporter ATPase, putative ABC transport system ATP-binding protein [Candidatus Campbellbacteria bacterium GW2011_OD1_34_28]KKP75469.1 MAG: ABC-type antimicrobial peptide transport system, ATPase component [Candidatus Campbellbacteria bacterium GW2011_GWD2_35_24]KKP75970.1 MAG: hypothetical protein UR75_C0001G0004 [Candidatus Campbellbacteria bacterium GW2011_GWC2_35_28]KKP77159.1 MAG: ABC-type antimicrobial peptide transport system, ATPase component [Candidat